MKRGDTWLSIPIYRESLPTLKETRQEAVSAAEELRKAWTEEHLQKGWPIPLPGDLSSCNGTLTVRIPVSLHRRLKMKAKRENTSLNQYAAYLLSRGG